MIENSGKCKINQYRCNSGECIPNSWVCDGAKVRLVIINKCNADFSFKIQTS